MTAVRFPVSVHLALGADPFADPSTWTWTTDISTYVYVRDGGMGTSIERGRLNEQQIAGPSSCTLQLNNRDGRFSRLNPTGAYYGQLRKNTPIRVRIDAGSGFVTRFVGLVSEWPVSWNPRETDFWVDVRADGILRLLGQGRAPARSAPYRYLADLPDGSTPVAAWTLEEGHLASGGTPLYGAYAMTPFTGAHPSGAVVTYPQWGSGTLAPWLPPVVSRSGGGGLTILWAKVSMPTFTNTWTIDHVLAAGTGGPVSALDVNPSYLPGGGTSGWPQLMLDPLVEQILVAFDTPETSVEVPDLFDGLAHHVRWTCTQDGADVDWSVWVDGDVVLTGTETTYTLTAITSLGLTAESTSSEVANGYVSVWTTPEPVADYTAAVLGYPDELAGERFARLCVGHGLISDVVGSDVATMGPQPTSTLLPLLRECETASQGVMLERRTGELGLDLVSVRENAAVGKALDYAQRHVAEPFGPSDDDLGARNDITAVSTLTGNSARATDEDSIAEIGRYDDALHVNAPDEWLPHHAGWRLNLGTSAAREYRWPTLQLTLHDSRMASLRATWAALDVGSRITIDNLPANLPPDLVDLMVEGYTERFDNYEWHVTINCSPYRPYGIFVLAEDSGDTDEFLGRLVPDTCYSVDAHDADDTAWLVFTDPYWTRTADDFSCLVRVGGEDATLTAIESSGDDNFFRTEAGGWGTADSGQAWTVVPGGGGSAADFTVTTAPNGHARITPAGLSSDYKAVIDIGGADRDVSMEVYVGSLPATGVLRIGVIPRYVDTSNFVHAELRIATTGLMELRIIQRVAGSATTLLTMGMGGFVLAADTRWTIRTKAVGTTVKARAWLTSGTEPWWWCTATTGVTTGDLAGAFCRNESASAAHIFKYDNLDVREPANWTLTRSVNGVSKSHSAAAEIEVAEPMVLGF